MPSPSFDNAKTFDDLALAGLSPSQLQAVTTTEGYVRVIAGAGSGKTRALAYRFAYLVNVLGVAPSNILCVTFTNKAANEMRQRIHRLTGDNDTGYINTFHGFCVSVLQEDIDVLAFPRSFLVLDNSDIDAMLKIVYEERGLTLRDKTFAKARDMFEIRKLFSEPQYYLDLLRLSIEDIKLKYLLATEVDDILFYGYLYQQKKCYGLDYNDLIVCVLHLFEVDEAVKLKWQKRLEYIMIDEFQDIDGLQYRLMEALSGFHKNLFVVGDPDQTIYTWRGANVKYLMEFEGNFPDTTTVMMNENYRSTPEITMVANSLINANKTRIKKSLKSQNESGERVRVYHAKSSQDEAGWIVGQIGRLVSDGAQYRDICLLYRAHYVTRSLEESLVKSKIPYTIFSGVQFFERQEIKDALAYLRLVAFRDDLSFERVANRPKRNLGERRMKFLRQFAEGQQITLFEALRRSLDNEIMKGTQARQLVELVDEYTKQAESRNISDLLAALMEQSGYERMLRTEGSQERLDNLAELRQAVYEYETSCGEEATLDNFMKHVALLTNLDAGMDANKVKLMTIHAAKGLEFPYVFLCSLNEGVIPSRKTQTVDAMEEERRLGFVAITRAEKGLYLTCADGADHEGIPRYPSRFVFDIDDDLLDFETPLNDSLVRDAKRYYSYKDTQLNESSCEAAFAKGDRVVHRVFGEGSIVNVDHDKRAYIIAFDSMETTRSLTFRAPLKALE